MSGDFLTPNKRISHYGSAKSGTHHFWLQRLTAIANIALSAGLVWIVLKVVGKPYAEVITLMKHPLVAITLLLFALSVTTHMRLGMQVIIEDYVHCGCKKTALIIFNNFFTITLAVAAAFSILKIAFMG